MTITIYRCIALLGLIMTLAGCSLPAGLGSVDAQVRGAVAHATPVSAGRTTTQSPFATVPPTPAADTSTGTDDAIKRVIQKANDEQQQAFARHDPTLMADTATNDYYQQLVQTNSKLATGGVSAIKLMKLEWGSVTMQADGEAQATTFETWQTSFADGGTEQDRERNVYTLVQQNGNWKVRANDHPDADTAQVPGGADATTVPPAGPTPRVPRASTTPSPAGAATPAPATGTMQSRNWSGYEATGGTYTAVSGSWTVPQVASGDTTSGDATWVGIGGANTDDLIQAGTSASVQGSRVRYTAWVEMLPAYSRPITLAVSPGDVVTVSISEQGDGTWRIAFKNQTTGQQYQTTETYNSSHSSAEWIEEAPSGNRRQMALDNFGTVQFHDGTAMKDGKDVTIAGAGARPITMRDRSARPLAQPSVLTSDGASFSVSRTDVSSVAPAATDLAPIARPGGRRGQTRP